MHHDTASLARALISPKTGIVKGLTLLPWSGSQIPLMHMVAPIPSYGALPCGGSISRPGGSAIDLDSAVAQVVFEVVERYSAAFVDYSSLVFGQASSTAFVTGAELPLFAEHQYQQEGWPFQRLRDDSAINWVRCRSLLTGRSRFVPAVLVYIPYRPVSRDELLGPSTSTGMAAGRSFDAACLAGLLEVCEREGFNNMWMHRLSMPLLDVDATPLGAEISELLRACQGEVTFVDISTDLRVPTVMAVLRQPLFGRPLVTVGASAKPTFERACRKALGEAVSEYERIRVRMEETGQEEWRPADDFSNVTDFEWHGLSYWTPEMQEHLEFMTASSVTRRLEQDIEFHGDDRSALLHFLAILETKVSDVVVVELTTRELEELGVCAVKVMVPELVPLHPDHRYPWLGHRRLYEIPGLLGYRSYARTPEELNPYPHPFS
jgi:ribosomal protein S12 methylthiotransferase accessory factor